MSNDEIQIGDLVVCINKGDWRSVLDKRTMTGPRYGESLYVTGKRKGLVDTDKNFLSFEEYPFKILGDYAEHLFIKVINPPKPIIIKDDGEIIDDITPPKEKYVKENKVTEEPKPAQGERAECN